MPRKGNRCTTMVNFQLTPLEATALQAVVVHFTSNMADQATTWTRYLQSVTLDKLFRIPDFRVSTAG